MADKFSQPLEFAEGRGTVALPDPTPPPHSPVRALSLRSHMDFSILKALPQGGPCTYFEIGEGDTGVKSFAQSRSSWQSRYSNLTPGPQPVLFPLQAALLTSQTKEPDAER